MEYFGELATELGISLWLLVIVIIWSAVWKFLALWKSARKNHLVWFIVFAIVNTMGILEILYIYVFSEKRKKPEKESTPKEKTRKKKRK